MFHKIVENLLSPYYDGELNWILDFIVKQHIARCDRCQEKIKQFNNIEIARCQMYEPWDLHKLDAKFFARLEKESSIDSK